MGPIDRAYRHPVLYDLEYQDLSADIQHYKAIARRRGGPILELGVGNGRIALPLARSGIQVHGVDLSADMLRSLHAKLDREPLHVQKMVQTEQADFRQLHGPQRYRTVFLPFNAIHHCTHHQDLLDLLASVDRVLLPEGQFYLDCYLPDPILHGRDPDETYGHTTFTHPTLGVPIESWEQSWYDPIAQVHHVVYTYVVGDASPTTVKLDLRVFHYQEMLALLDWGGFRIRSEAGSFRGDPVTAGSTKWVLQLERTPEPNR